MKRIKVEIYLVIDLYKPPIYYNSNVLYKSERKNIRINVFFGGGKYFTFYSSNDFRRRALKRTTWAYEILYRNRIRILEGVIKEEGRYEYKETTISPYLMRRIIEKSDKPWIDPYEC